MLFQIKGERRSNGPIGCYCRRFCFNMYYFYGGKNDRKNNERNRRILLCICEEGSGLYECRARGIFRNKKMKPNVGDVVDIDILSEEEKTGNLVKIHKRKNQLIRPMAANVDQALVIFAVHEPEPNFHLLNRFLIDNGTAGNTGNYLL